jgi:hypothetical protein
LGKTRKKMSKKKNKPGRIPTADTRTRTRRLKDEWERFHSGVFNAVAFYKVLQTSMMRMKKAGQLTGEIQAEIIGAEKATDFILRRCFKFNQERLTKMMGEVAGEYLDTESDRFIEQQLKGKEKSRVILPGAPNPDLRGKLIIPEAVLDPQNPSRKLTPDDLRARGA